MSEGLIKYCKKEHNVRNGSRIRVGTLHCYRKIENPALQDGEEGILRFRVKGRGVIALELANALFHRTIELGEGKTFPRTLPGTTSFQCNYLSADPQGDLVEIDVDGDLTFDMGNCWIFCASMGATMPEAITTASPFAGEYDDRWIVSNTGEDAGVFGFKLCNLLRSKAAIDNIVGSNAMSIEQVSQITIQGNAAEVKYTGRDNLIDVGAMEGWTFQRFYDTYLSVPFLKPDSYKNEREFRFCFWPMLGNRHLIVKSNFVDLNTNALFD